MARPDDLLPWEGHLIESSESSAACIPPWLALYMRLQAELNTLSSVSIEVPALRPAAKTLREALGD